MIASEATHLALFALTIAVGQLTPGPDMLVILKNTLNHGLRAGLWTVAGICVGLTAHVTLAFLGLGLVLQRSPSLDRAIRLLAGLYLLWIAWQLLRSIRSTSGELALEPTAANIPAGAAFRQGLFTNLLNPKVVIFFSSVLAPFAAGHGEKAWLYAAIIMLEAVTLWPLFAWVMQRPAIRQGFFRWQGWVNAAFALLLIIVAGTMFWR